MKKVRVAINGFGRIGRMVLRAFLSEHSDEFKIVAINDLASPEMNAHLLKHDSNYGKFPETVELEGDVLWVGGEPIRICRVREISELPWKKEAVDIVIEATGIHKDAAAAREHIAVGAKRVIISAPAKDPDATFVVGVNHDTYDPKRHYVVSNASCTTNSLAPLAKVLNEEFTIEYGSMTTIHSYTGDQRLLDAYHPKDDLRRARGAAQNIIPTKTGAAEAIGEVIPALEKKLHGIAVRVPTPTVSLTDLVVVTKKKVTRDAVIEALQSRGERWDKEGFKILRVEGEPLVSSDYIGEEYSTVVDEENVAVMEDRLVKVIAWYDNEWAYSHRVADLAAYMLKQGI